MKGSITIILLLTIVFLLYILRLSRSMKYNARLSKYTVNNNIKKRLSLGDIIINIYNSFQNELVMILKKSVYFKNKSLRYEKYNYLNKPINIIASKFCFTLIFAVIYILLSIFNKTFELFSLIVFMILTYYIYDIKLIINKKIRDKRIEEDLSKAIIIMNNTFKSGYNIIQAIDFVSEDLSGPISDEFKKISNDLKYGLELKDVFERFYNRVKIEDVKFISSSLSLLSVTGGNLVGIFTNIERSFNSRKRLKDELNSMISSSKLVFYILLIMPILLVIALSFFNPEYFNPLFNHPIGILICFIIVILYISYIFIIRKIMKLD